MLFSQYYNEFSHFVVNVFSILFCYFNCNLVYGVAAAYATASWQPHSCHEHHLVTARVVGSNRCPLSSRRRLGRGSLSALSSCLRSHQGVRRHSRPKGHSTPKRPVTGLGNLSTTPTAAPRARGVRQLYSQQPLAKTMYVSLGPADADRQPCGGTTQDLQFVNRFDPTAAGRLCNCACCVQHALSICRRTTTPTPLSNVATSGLRFVRLPDCPTTRS